MRFRRLLWMISLAVMLASTAALPLAAQAGGTPQTTNAATASPAPATPGQAYTLAPDKLAKAIKLSRIRNILSIAGSIWGIAFVWILLAAGGWAGLEVWAQNISDKRWVQGLVFFAAYFIILTLASLPLDLWANVSSAALQRSGVQGWGSWFGDEAEGVGADTGARHTGPAALQLDCEALRWPRRYWLGIWVATVPILVFFIFVAPLLAPIFDKFEPLEQNHAGLVTELEKVAVRTGTNIPPDRMYLMKASLKTNGLNAYVNGIGATKRIVVWDTTAGKIPNDEVLFIFGHESGHYVLHHIPQYIAIYSIGLFFTYWACAGLAGVDGAAVWRALGRD